MAATLHVCDQCECTMTATLSDLCSKHGWRRWTGKHEPIDGLQLSWTLLLCDECRPDKSGGATEP
jgi:hypothetical protein